LFKGPGPGRPKGMQNKTTQSVKAALTEAFEQMGGVKSLVAWGEAEPAEFYRIWGRLVPHEVSGEGGGPITIKIVTGIERSPDE
jgi:hypothetical protein